VVGYSDSDLQGHPIFYDVCFGVKGIRQGIFHSDARQAHP
jgi:hypothetical protein